MNRRLVFVTAVVAVGLMSVASYGQRPGQGRGQGQPGRGMRGGMMGGPGGIVGLLRSEPVRKEIGVTEAQQGKLRELASSGERPRFSREDFQNLSQEERQKKMAKMREGFTKLAAAQEKKLAEVLDKKQIERLHQIRLQSLRSFMFRDAELTKKLNLTDDQKEKMQAVQREVFQKMRAAVSGGGRPDPSQFAKVQKELMAKTKELLTDEQQATLKKCLGKPFDVSQLRSMGRGGRGGGRPGQGRPGQGRPGQGGRGKKKIG